jgi:pimeloyl-ACP methyl ester carboxylesterase
MVTFGLVHGAWHGAWCWELLAAELERLGHAAVAVDLACEDWDAHLEDNAAVIAAALDGAGPDPGAGGVPQDAGAGGVPQDPGAGGVPQDVVLVGHSLGGITIPVVATRRPVSRLVFLCALVPEPGRSLDETIRADGPPSTDEWVNARRIAHPDGAASWEPESAISAMYHDCPPELARWAASQLRRQVWTTSREPCPLERWPEVPSSYILGTEDKAFPPEWARRIAKERLDVEAVELPGGHSPMLARPRHLAEVLSDLVG